MKVKQHLLMLMLTLTVSLAFSLTGCRSSQTEPSAAEGNTEETNAAAAPGESSEAAPEPAHDAEHRGRDLQGSVLEQIDPAACEPSYREFLGEHYADYQALMQALVERQPTVTVDEDMADSLIAHMEAGPYGALADSTQVNGGEITIVYRFDEAEHQEKRELLDNFFLKLINEHVSAEDNEMEIVLALYQGLMEIETNGTYIGEEEEVPDMLNVLESGDAQSSQFAEILAFSLHQFDMEAFPMVVRADYPEVVVYAKIGEGFYYFDPYYEAMSTMGDGLMGFGMTAEDLEGYLGSSQAEAWNAQGEASPRTPELFAGNPFASFRMVSSWSWGDNHTLEATDINDNTFLFHTDTLEAEGLPEAASAELSIKEMYPIFDSIVRTMYEEGAAYEPSRNSFVWGVLGRLCCNYGYYFEGVSFEELGYVLVPAETMDEMAGLCFSGLTLPEELPEDGSVERKADGSYRLPLVNMSDEIIRLEDTELSEEGGTVSVGIYLPGEEPGEEEKAAEYIVTCRELPETAADVFAFGVSGVTED